MVDENREVLSDALNTNLDGWMKPEQVHPPMVTEPGHIKVRRDPLGVTLIIGAPPRRSARRWRGRGRRTRDVSTARAEVGPVYSRFINSGHICTAPDHVLIWPEVKDEFVTEIKATFHEFYGDDPILRHPAGLTKTRDRR